MTPPQHLFFFTPRSITLILEAAGLRVVELSHPWKRVPLSLFAYQLLRFCRVETPIISSADQVGSAHQSLGRDASDRRQIVIRETQPTCRVSEAC